MAILTYLVNQLRAGEAATPYSMVSALKSPLLPADLRDDEIVINQWLADDLNIQPGAELSLEYFAPDQIAQLIERTNRFRVRAVIPMTHPLCDRSLMPDFPGVAKAEHAGDWETSFPLVHKIRPKDDEYWQRYRGTPKAFVTLAAGQSMWANRFGNVTALRLGLDQTLEEPAAVQLLRETEQALKRALRDALTGEATSRAPSIGNASSALRPQISAADLGFEILPVRQQALAAASQSQDFGGLFLGFSFFLILAALILMALLFQFGLEQRTAELGTLLALGFEPRRVRRLLLGEGTALAFVGGVIGVAGGIVYAKAMLHGLTTVWREAVGTSTLTFHVTSLTLIIGLFSAVAVSALTIWLVLRKQARQPARALLMGEVEGRAGVPPAPGGGRADRVAGLAKRGATPSGGLCGGGGGGGGGPPPSPRRASRPRSSGKKR